MSGQHNPIGPPMTTEEINAFGRKLDKDRMYNTPVLKREELVWEDFKQANNKFSEMRRTLYSTL